MTAHPWSMSSRSTAEQPFAISDTGTAINISSGMSPPLPCCFLETNAFALTPLVRSISLSTTDGLPAIFPAPILDRPGGFSPELCVEHAQS